MSEAWEVERRRTSHSASRHDPRKPVTFGSEHKHAKSVIAHEPWSTSAVFESIVVGRGRGRTGFSSTDLRHEVAHDGTEEFWRRRCAKGCMCYVHQSPWLRSSERRVEFPVKEARAQ